MPRFYNKLLRCTLALALLSGLLHSAPAEGARLELIPSLAVREEFSDNLFFDADDEETDWLTTVTPALQLKQQDERRLLQATARLDALRYVANDDLDAIDQHYLASINYRWTPRLAVSGQAQYTRDSRPDRDLEETGLVLSNERRDQETFGGSAEYAVSERSRLSLGYNFSRLDYQEDESADSDSHYAILGWHTEITERLKSITNFNYSHSEFKGARLDNAVLETGFAYAACEQWSLQALAGARYTRSRYEELIPVYGFFLGVPILVDVVKQDSSSSDWGWVAQLSASWQGELSSASLSLQRQVRLASGRTGSTETTALIISGSHRLGENLFLNLSGGYYLNQANANEFAGSGIDEKTLRLSPGLRYRWNEDLDITLGYSTTLLEDQEADQDTTRNLAFIRLDYQYPLEF